MIPAGRQHRQCLRNGRLDALLLLLFTCGGLATRAVAQEEIAPFKLSDVSADLTGAGEGVTGIGVAVGEGVVGRVGVNVGSFAGIPVDVRETNAVGMVSLRVGLTSAPFPPSVAARLAWLTAGAQPTKSPPSRNATTSARHFNEGVSLFLHNCGVRTNHCIVRSSSVKK